MTEGLLRSIPPAGEMKKSELPQYAQRLSKIWQERFTNYFRSGQSQFPLAVEDLVCAVGRYELTQLLRVDLDEISMLDWSNIMWKAAAPQEKEGGALSLPGWLVIPGLAQLGFIEEAMKVAASVSGRPGAPLPKLRDGITPDKTALVLKIFSRGPLEPSVNDWRELIERRYPTSGEGRPVVVVLALKGTSVAKNWKPSSRYAVFLYTNAEKEFMEKVAKDLLPFMRIVEPVRAMAELNPDDPDLVRKLVGTPMDLGKEYEDFEDAPYNYLLARAPAISLPQGIVVAIAPQSLDEAIDKTPGISQRTRGELNAPPVMPPP